MTIFIDDRIHARPSAVMDTKLLLLVTFLRRIAFFLDMVWMHSVLARGGILISVLAFGLNVPLDFMDLTPDGNLTTHNNTINDEYKQSNSIHSGPSATMEDKEAGISLMMLLVQLSLARDIATLVFTNLQITDSTINRIFIAGFLESMSSSVTWKQKLRKPPDKILSHNNQKSSLFRITLPITFHLIGMNIANGTFNSEGEITINNLENEAHNNNHKNNK